MTFERDLAIVGGCGRAGLPLGLAFADRGLRVVLHDLDDGAVDSVNARKMPFDEAGAPEILDRVVGAGRLVATTRADAISGAEHVVVIVGTPLDERQDPDVGAVPQAVEAMAQHLVDGQLLVLRSTVYPGVTETVEALVQRLGLDVDVAFCPHRTVEGRALAELGELPELVSARSDRALARAEELFRRVSADVVRLEPEEAELAKLFSNAWRYITFAVSNQFFMMANDLGLDFERIRAAMTHGYPRAGDLPGAGFAAGPCLHKDTVQLTAVDGADFPIGRASITINQGLPEYVVSRLQRRYDLSTMTVGLLGMAFKAESDDIRSSLSYELKGILEREAGSVLCSDPYVTVDPELVLTETVLERSDLVIIAAPHRMYADVAIEQPVVDIWNVRGRGVRI